jgi:hypothetical protein
MKQPKGTAISLAAVCSALIKLGQMASDIRGSVGGTTFARNRHGAYARNRTKPVNVINDLTTSSRARFGSQAFGWTALTQAQRDVWNADAGSVTLLNRLGEAYTPTGRQLFLTANNNLAQAGLTLLTDSPGYFTIPDPANGEVAIASLLGVINTFVFTAGQDANVVISATPATSGTRQNFQSLLRYIGNDAWSTGANDLKAAYEAKYGTLASPGQTIVLSIKSLDSGNGMASAPGQFSALVTGT